MDAPTPPTSPAPLERWTRPALPRGPSPLGRLAKRLRARLDATLAAGGCRC